MRVRRVRVAAQAIDDPQLDAGECREGLLVEFGHVGRIGKSADTNAQCRAEPVILYERHDFDAGDLERPGDLVRYQGRLIVAARLLDRFEHIAETTADLGQRLRLGVERDRASHQPVDRPQVIDAMEMVGMCVGHHYRVEPRYTRIEKLLAEIRGSIDQYGNRTDLDQHRYPATAVA